MSHEISPTEAAAALAEVESARIAMRRAIQVHRGHLHLWIWGLAWVAMPLIAWARGDSAARYFWIICVVGVIASAIAGSTQRHQLRWTGPTRRFQAVVAAVIGFAVLFPFVLHAKPEPRLFYLYCCIVSMQVYVIAGLWSDTFLLWLGLAVTVLLCAALVIPSGLFWPWMAVFGGGTLFGTGCYVRYFWK